MGHCYCREICWVRKTDVMQLGFLMKATTTTIVQLWSYLKSVTMTTHKLSAQLS